MKKLMDELFPVEELMRHPDVNGDSVMVGDKVRHFRAGFTGEVTRITRDRGRVVFWVGTQEWNPHDVRRVG